MVYRTRIHTDFQDLKYKTLTQAIIAIFFKVYNKLGYGFLEKVYENALMYEFKKAEIPAVSQSPIKVIYEGEVIGEYFADLIIDDLVIVELKAAEFTSDSHENQLINYLKATEIEVGLLLNFGKKPEFRRKIYTNDRKV